MSGRGKGGKVKGKAKSRSSVPVSSFRWAGYIVFRKGNYAERVGAGAPVIWPPSGVPSRRSSRIGRKRCS
ncbi:unnamed protein product [Tenebrio molitor]|nr:unnamed protein product [Tenebrio molitor]